MRLKLLLVSLLMVSGMLYAQDTIKTLVITEARINDPRFNYIEFTNMGTEAVNLCDFEFGRLDPWTDRNNDPGAKIIIGEYLKKYLPGKDTMLGAGETFWISTAHDFNREMSLIKPDQWGPVDRVDQYEADIVFHFYEAPSGPTDSVSANYNVMEAWNGRDCWYLEYHFEKLDGSPDSAMVDQFGGVFDDGGYDPPRNFDNAYDVAGVTRATATHAMVRKFTVKEGNINFEAGRGIDLDDSEWMPIQAAKNYSQWLVGDRLRWTVGNHGDYNLNETTLTSSTLDIHWDTRVIDVPWGVHNKDSVMMQMDYHPGLAWHYQLSTKPVGDEGWAAAQVDSSFISARTGDTLIVWACGNDLDEIKFHINLLPHTDDANWVVPKAAFDYENKEYGDWHGPVFEVTHGVPVMDTILEVPFATRTDSILKYFEKAPEADWEIIFVGGVERPDVVDGDLLRVTAQNGNVKDYYIQVEDYLPSHNAYLSSIRWPDTQFKDIYGYIGDTIPGYNERKYNYRAIVPEEVTNVPALLAKTVDLNTKVEIERAISLAGTVAERTTTFTSTAEDDTTIRVYNVEFYRLETSATTQPWSAEPFLSEVVFHDQWANSWLELCNPGTEPLDLSYYMIGKGPNDPVEAVQAHSGEDNWAGRYAKYIPGRKWVDEAQWAITPGRVEATPDANVNPVVLPGDVFVMGSINGDGTAMGYYTSGWPARQQSDILFKDPANENNNVWGEAAGNTLGDMWFSDSYYVWKILNDSVRNGTKAATDPNDFELLETWATVTNEGTWIIGGTNVAISGVRDQTLVYRRKPQFVVANPEIEGSWGTQADNGTRYEDGTSEWDIFDRTWGQLNGYGWPYDILYITEDLGSHYYEPTTVYRSVVVSKFYKVSVGYTDEETIDGLVDGITVSEFFGEIDKLDEGEVLSVVSGSSGVPLTDDAAIADGDTLVVVSADGTNTTKYLLGVTAEGLSDDATLTSDIYTVTYDGASGTVGGFDLGTTVRDVFNGVTVPAGASINVIDKNDAPVPFVTLNFDTLEVDVIATSDVYFEVIAENFKAKITYQLTPNVTDADAFVVSNTYEVDQETNLISLVPKGTTVPSFYSNLTPSAGATMQVKDKAGFDRNYGTIYQDDKLTVTAADGETENTYFLTLLKEAVNYLAYALSDVYIVDQNAFTITGAVALDINDRTLVSEFLGNLEAAPGATMTVVADDMTAKDGGEFLSMGDMLEVVAGNATTVVYYDIAVEPSSVRDAAELNISVYPNPSNGAFNVTGLETGSRIRVYNALGSLVLDNVVVNTTEVISVEGKKQGFYFMTISNETGVLGQFKLIVE